MAKFPSQRLLTYETGLLSNDAWTSVVSGSVAGDLNLPRDLSVLNMRGYASTTRKGVPLVYRTMIKVMQQDQAGKQVGVNADSGGNASVETDDEIPGNADFSTTLRVVGCQNNWVMRNAAVKFHAAREKMFRDAGVTRKQRGAYSHEIRYAYDAYNDTWIVPIDGSGDAFTLGEWELSHLSYTGDSEFTLKLVGAGDDEESNAFSGNDLQIGHSYLMSRINQAEDTNEESDEGPALFSVLSQMLSGDSGATSALQDDVVEEARTSQDEPPYELIDISNSGDTGHNIHEPVELGRAIAGQGSAIGSVIVDIPFGLANVQARHSGADDQNIVDGVFWTAEVLDIFEMQG